MQLQYDRQDAKAYLMERRGNVEKAFKLLLEDLRTGITALTRAAQHVYDQGGLVNMSDVVEQLAKQPGNLYLPATVTSAAAAVAASSGNPLEMAPVLGKGQGGESAEASAPKPVKKSAELEAENKRVPCFPEFQQMYHALMVRHSLPAHTSRRSHAHHAPNALISANTLLHPLALVPFPPAVSLTMHIPCPPHVPLLTPPPSRLGLIAPPLPPPHTHTSIFAISL